MSRASLLDALPSDLLAAVLARVGDAEDPFDRALPAHVTASALVLDAARERVLLVHHAKLRLWVQPGGHVEPADASVADAALREAREETGVEALQLVGDALDLDVHPAPCKPRGAGDHLDVLFACVAPDDAVLAVSSESNDVAWFFVDAPPDDAVPGLAQRLVAARQAVLTTW